MPTINFIKEKNISGTDVGISWYDNWSDSEGIEIVYYDYKDKKEIHKFIRNKAYYHTKMDIIIPEELKEILAYCNNYFTILPLPEADNMVIWVSRNKYEYEKERKLHNNFFSCCVNNYYWLVWIKES